MKSSWGIFKEDSGQPVIEADVVLRVEFQNDYRVSDYPQEKGAFASYNKVQIPFRAKLTFLKGGTDAARTALLTALEEAVKSLDLVTVSVPEFSYKSGNIIHYDYRREAAKGATLLAVDVWVEEIRVLSATKMTNTQSVNGAATESGGTVQPEQTSLQPGGATQPTPAPAATTTLADPAVGPAVYDGINTGFIPSTYGGLTPQQQNAIVSYGGGAGSATVTTNDPSIVNGANDDATVLYNPAGHF
jgi:hypothetical protein